MKYNLLLLFFALTIAACKGDVSPELSDSSHRETHVHDEFSVHSKKKQQARNSQNHKAFDYSKLAVIPNNESFKSFDSQDSSTWGEVVETNQDGTPTRYLRRLPDGGYETIVFAHGLQTTFIVDPDGSPSSEFLHWNRPNKGVPIVVLNATIEPRWGGYLATAVRSWDKSEMFNVRMGYFTGEERSETARLQACQDYKNGFILVCEDDLDGRFISHEKDPGSGDLGGGYARLRATPNGHIYAGMIIVNNDFPLIKEDIVGIQVASEARQWLLCHEVGHALGLWHREGDQTAPVGSCMAQQAKYTGENVEPDQHDLDELKSIYSHTHSNDVAVGFLCEKAKGTRTTRSYMQRVEFNGMEAIAKTQLIEDTDHNRQHYSRSVTFTTRTNAQIHYNWHLPNHSNMRTHIQGRSGEFPRIQGHEVSVFDSSVFMPVDYEMAEATLDAKVNVIRAFQEQYSGEKADENCTVLTTEEHRDVDHFIPPKDGSSTGSFKVNELSKDSNGKYITENGSFVKLDDYELFYEYLNERKESPKGNLIDPLITPITRL